MRVAILLVLHDGRDMLASFLESIQAQTHKDWQLIVIDEATTDGSSALVRQYVPHAVVLRNARDRGWAHGLNQAMRLALSHKNVDALLWTDTRMAFQPNCLERLVASFGDARVGVVGPVVFQMFEENRLEEALHERVESDYVYSAGMEGGCGGPYVLRGYGQRGHAGDDVRETLAVVRYALLVKRSALECARLHDELFVDTVLESEGVDVDLCLRVQNAGSRVCLVSDAHAYLARGVFKGVPRRVSPSQQLRLRCSSSQHALAVRNTHLLFWMHTRFQVLVVRAPIIVWNEARWILFLLLHDRRALLSLWRCLPCVPHVWRRRRLMKHLRRLARV